MATRRRIGVSIASTEAARRQLMQPVPCWEKVWVTPDSVSTGSSNLKVYKWIKTEKVQVCCLWGASMYLCLTKNVLIVLAIQ